jgi:hypothetical protein
MIERSAYESTAYDADEAVEAAALALGCSVLYSNDYTLQLDLDSEAAWEFFLLQVEEAERLEFPFQREDIRVLRSKSGNRHVLIPLTAPIDTANRIALQSFLGSDRTREMLAWYRMANGLRNDPVVLFRPIPEEEGKSLPPRIGETE